MAGLPDHELPAWQQARIYLTCDRTVTIPEQTDRSHFIGRQGRGQPYRAVAGRANSGITWFRDATRKAACSKFGLQYDRTKTHDGEYLS